MLQVWPERKHSNCMSRKGKKNDLDDDDKSKNPLSESSKQKKPSEKKEKEA